MDSLQYRNEDDRAYGLAGMAISLAALDALDRVADISLDADGPMVSFSHAYYFSGSPSVSPKSSWLALLENFNITASMAVANLMARSIVRDGEDVSTELLDSLLDVVSLEGLESCALEADEVRSLFNNTLRFNSRIFGNPRVRPAVSEFVRVISRRRQLSGTEVRDELHLLGLL